MQPSASAPSPQLATEHPNGAATSEVRHLWCSDIACTVLELCETPREVEDSSAAIHGLP